MRVVSISPYMPCRGIPHAGGEFYRRHAELAAVHHEVVVVSPRTAENEAAVDGSEGVPYRRLLVGPSPRTSRGRRERLHSLLTRAVSFLGGRPFSRALLDDEAVMAELRAADRIELQWFDCIVLAPRLRRAVPGTPIVGVFHDVVSQGHARMLSRGRVPLRSRALSLVRWALAVPLEQRAMRTLHTAVVLSEKDRALLTRRGGSARVVVVLPALDDVDMPAALEPGSARKAEVLFVGALWRPENEDAAIWLLRDIWPEIRTRVPGARLTVAGARPGPALQAEAQDHQDVELTGYVPSLSPYYQRASVVVAPIRLGAGVQLKTVVAMMWGLPVVATPLAAEGVLGPGVFAAVESRGARFAQAVVRVLESPASADEVRSRAFDWSHERYSAAAYLRALDEVYRQA